MSNKINVAIAKSTHERLIALGSKNESFDAIIQRLLVFYDTHKEAQS